MTIISHQNATAILNHTPSASGERYVNTEGFFGHGGRMALKSKHCLLYIHRRCGRIHRCLV
ncbi:MliC family protein [Moraxella catarrhalis]|uniref:MliC family protein n=1 Tax=Moraxella catarrhalis TaxID=480 RepID=UPI0039B6EB81